MSDTPAPTLPLRLVQHGTNTPVLTLAGIDITRFVAADGLQLAYDASNGEVALPTVTIKFGLGKLDLDLDVELLERLLVDARAKAVDR